MNRLSRHATLKGLRREQQRSHIVPCPLCSSSLRFDVPDPMRLGRSMEQCSNRYCASHEIHVIKPQSLSA